MHAAIAWDQTLLSLLLAIVAAAVAYWAAARALQAANLRREAGARREALEQVLAMLDGPAGEYLRDPECDYPQREMVELERRAVQAQMLFWRDLKLQHDLNAMTSPEAHAAAADRLRAVLRELTREAGPAAQKR